MSDSESLDLPDPIRQHLIPRCPTVQMSGDIILLDIDGVVPEWETYEFAINTVQPGEKVSLGLFFAHF